MSNTNQQEEMCWTCGENIYDHKVYRDALDETELTCDRCHREEYPEEYDCDDDCETEDEEELCDFECETCERPFKTDVPFKAGDDDIPPKCLECFQEDEDLKKFIKDALAANDARDKSIINRLTLKDEEE